MKKIALILMIPSLSMASDVPIDIKDGMNSICKYVANGDSIREAACVEVMVITYKAGYSAAAEDKK